MPHVQTWACGCKPTDRPLKHRSKKPVLEYWTKFQAELAGDGRYLLPLEQRNGNTYLGNAVTQVPRETRILAQLLRCSFDLEIFRLQAAGVVGEGRCSEWFHIGCDIGAPIPSRHSGRPIEITPSRCRMPVAWVVSYAIGSNGESTASMRRSPCITPGPSKRRARLQITRKGYALPGRWSSGGISKLCKQFTTTARQVTVIAATKIGAICDQLTGDIVEP